jgi:hypothetical protein
VGSVLPGFEASAFVAVGAPRNAPTEIIDRLHREINAGLADPKIKGRLAELGGSTFVSSPAELNKLIADEVEVGQGSPGDQHQSRVGRPLADTFRKFRSANPAVGCPLWVISGHQAFELRCLLYPRKRTSMGRQQMSASDP